MGSAIIKCAGEFLISRSTLSAPIIPINPIEPDAVSGLILWLKADAGVTYDGSGNVTFWQDQSGEGNDFASESGGEPIFVSSEINSKPVIDFAGSKYLSASVDYNFTGQTFICVFKYSQNATNYGRLISQWDGTTRDFLVQDSYLPFLKNQGSNEIATYAGGWFFGESVSDGLPYIAISRHDGSNFYLQLNNNAEQSDQSTLNTHISDFRISASNVGELADFFNSKIAEIVIYDNAISQSNKNGLLAYLNNKYAIY